MKPATPEHDAARRIARLFSVSVPTVERWLTGQNTPHDAMLRPVFERLVPALHEAYMSEGDLCEALEGLLLDGVGHRWDRAKRARSALAKAKWRARRRPEAP